MTSASPSLPPGELVIVPCSLVGLPIPTSLFPTGLWAQAGPAGLSCYPVMNSVMR